MAEFFQAQAELDVQMTEEALRRYENICSAGFAKSTYVKQQMALAYYNLRGKWPQGQIIRFRLHASNVKVGKPQKKCFAFN